MRLKRKIYLAIILPPTIGLFLYALFVYRITLSDKEAYVYQTTLTLSQTTAQLIKSRLDRSLEESQSNDDRNSDVRATFWTLVDGQPTVVRQKGRAFPKEVAFIQPFTANPSPVYHSDLVSDGEAKYLALYYKLNPTSQAYASIFVPVPLLQSLLAKTTDFHLTLVNQTQARALVKSRSDIPDFAPDRLETLLQSSPGGSGTQELVDVKGQNELVSFAGLPSYPLSLVISIEKQKAFEAARRIAVQTAAFCVLLISVSFLIALVLSKKLTGSLLRLVDGTRAIAAGDLNVQLDVNSGDEIGILTGSFNVMVSKVKALLADTANKARMESELKTARTVQEMLLPKAENDFNGILVRGFSLPASECGGDFWFTYETAKSVMCMIGDVTGHGVASALITSAMRAVFALAEKRQSDDLIDLVEAANTAVWECTKASKTMTAFFVKYDKAREEIQTVNCSHLPLIVVPTESAAKGVTWRDFQAISDPVHRPLGESADLKVRPRFAKLQPGEELLFLTDGVFDAPNPSGKAFGERRTYQCVERYLSLRDTHSVAGDYVKEQLVSYQGGAEPYDDVTIVSFRVTAIPPA